MKLICVGGAWSSVGKTSVVELLLRVLPGWAAIKVTPSRPDEVCPLGTCCGACAAPEGPYEVITDPALLGQVGKDTARYLAAGATEVAWVRALPEALPLAIEAAMAGFSKPRGVIIESTTLIPVLSGIRILVAAEGISQVKESAQRCVGAIDLLAVNLTSQAEPAEPHPLIPVLQPTTVLPLCAVRSPADPRNADFVAYCRCETGDG